MLGLKDAAHEESSPDATRLVISKLSCSLVDQRETIQLKSGSLVHQLYGTNEVSEEYCCNYGLNPEYQEHLSQGRLNAVGLNADGEVRIVELAGHRFFVATLFLPQLSSSSQNPHPLIKRYLTAAMNFGRSRQPTDKELIVDKSSL